MLVLLTLPSVVAAQPVVVTGNSGSIGIPTTVSGAQDTYMFTIPNEKTVPIVEVEVLLPGGFQVLSIPAAPGWVATNLQNAAKWNGSMIAPNGTAAFVVVLQNPSLGLGFSSVQTFPVAAIYSDGSAGGWRLQVEVTQPTAFLGVQVSYLGLASVAVVFVLLLVGQFVPSSSVKSKHEPEQGIEATGPKSRRASLAASELHKIVNPPLANAKLDQTLRTYPAITPMIAS